MRIGSLVSAPVAIFILFCFFLPWVSVSCAGQNVVSLSGYDLASGLNMNSGLGAGRTVGDPWLYAIPLAALLSFVFALTTMNRNAGTGPASWQLVVALFAIGVLLFKWLQLENDVPETSMGMVTINTELGLWGTVGGLIVLVVGALMIQNEREDSFRQPRSSPAINRSPPAPACFNCGESFPRQVKFCPKCGCQQ